MPLPILQANRDSTPADLVRHYHRTELHWTRHLAEETPLDVGSAFANPDLPQVHDANRILEASVPEGMSPREAMQQVDEHYRQAGTQCAKWVLNPAAPAERTRPLAELLLGEGWRAHASDVLHLAGVPRGVIREVDGLTIIPARASFRHFRALAEEQAARWPDSTGLADAAMLHLDDPHWDAMLALKEGVAVGTAGVLAVGEIGLIQNLYVAQGHRRQGIGRTLMSRALEICQRSLFKHVLLCAEPDDAPAVQLYTRLGFGKVGEVTEYVRPGLPLRCHQ